MSNILDKHRIDPKIEEYLERVYRISKSYSTKRTYKVTLNKLSVFLGTINKDLSDTLYDLKEKKQDPILLLDDFYTYLSKVNLNFP